MAFLMDSSTYHGNSFNLPFFGKTDLLLDLADYDENFGVKNQYVNIIFTSFFIFGFFWVVEYAARAFWRSIDSPFTKAQRSVIILSRHTMDVVAMSLLVYTGFEALVSFNAGGFMGFNAMTGDIIVNGKVAAPGYERCYAYSAAAQRLCVLQMAYEMKNFCDSIIHNDGIIFLAHHFVTYIVSALATRPFLHLYACFFLGWSEISTVVLCVLVCFDEDHGIPGLGKAFPTLMTLSGVLFGVTFTVFRIILWPIVNYYWWSDMWIIYTNGSVHSNAEWYLYMSISVGLTILQMVWFKEIVVTAKAMLTNGGEIVIKRGEPAAASGDADNAKKIANKRAKSPAPKKAPSRGKSPSSSRSKSPAVRRSRSTSRK